MNKMVKPTLILVVCLVAVWLFSWVVVNVVAPNTIENMSSADRVPEGWEWVDKIVGYVWGVLLTIYVFVAWHLRDVRSSSIARPSALIGLYIAFCLSYVVIFGSSPELGLVGNIITILISSWIAWRIGKFWKLGGALIFASTIWVSVATVYLVLLIGNKN